MAVYQKVGGEFVVNSDLAGTQITPAFARLANGRLIAVWSSPDGTAPEPWGIYGRLLAADGTPLGSDFRINTATDSNQVEPAVTGLAGGGFVVTWRTWDPAQDGSLDAIKGQL